MSDYRAISLQDLEEAKKAMSHNMYRVAVFYFQQYAEKSAKALLEKKEPEHGLLKSHMVESILKAYDEKHLVSDLSDKARYLTSFYFNTRYPGDNYAPVVEVQALKAQDCAEVLEEYFASELAILVQAANSETVDFSGCKKLNSTGYTL